MDRPVKQTPPVGLFVLFLLAMIPLTWSLLMKVDLGFGYIALVLLSATFIFPRFAYALAGWLGNDLPRWFSQNGHGNKKRRGKSQQNAWNAVVLPENAKRELMTLQRILEDPNGYKKRWGMEPPLGAILHGPPGTGKTMIARALAGSAGYTFLAPSPAELNSMWVGESEKAIRALYDQARASAPCVVFLDELDTLAAQRSGSGSDRGGAGRTFNNATNQLLQEIDGFRGRGRVFTIGATNRLDILDAAITSRLGMHVHIGLPDTGALVNLFRLYTWPYHDRLDVSAEMLAYSATGMSGRDVQEVSKLAAMNAEGRGRERVGVQEFSEAFSRRGFSFPQRGAQTRKGHTQHAN